MIPVQYVKLKDLAEWEPDESPPYGTSTHERRRVAASPKAVAVKLYYALLSNVVPNI